MKGIKKTKLFGGKARQFIASPLWVALPTNHKRYQYIRVNAQKDSGQNERKIFLMHLAT
jgi:hypothetical protein